VVDVELHLVDTMVEGMLMQHFWCPEDFEEGSSTFADMMQAMRNLNSVVVPAFVSVPKSEEEEAAKKKA
jgi:hypothetical protein